MKDLLKKAWLAGILSLGFSGMGLADELALCKDQNEDHSCHESCKKIYEYTSLNAEENCKLLDVQQISKIKRIHDLLESPTSYTELSKEVSAEDLFQYIDISYSPFINSVKNYNEVEASYVQFWIFLNPEVTNIIRSTGNEPGIIIQGLMEAFNGY